MPQMGESIAEGTIVRWLKKVGDAVVRDEPLFEISTDKVDAEIPSPAAGVLTEITANEGDTVAVNAIVANIAAAGESSTPVATARAAASTPSQPVTPKPATAAGEGGSTQPQADGASKPVPQQPAARPDGSGGAEPSQDDLRRQKSSPLVRRIAREHHVDITQIPGSGIGGRVTKHDILGFIETGTAGPAGVDSVPTETRPTDPVSVGRVSPSPQAERGGPGGAAGTGSGPGKTEIQPLSVMRKKIAEHMILSRRTSAHVHSVFHVNFSTVEKIRQQKKADYERVGAKLTYMAFIAKAVVDALRRHPIINASLDGDNIIYKKDIHLGIAVALETGLIVPVIRNADERNILGLSRAIADVAERARAKQLKPDEVHGGTFTITNPGTFGAQFGMPIINQPQVAILGVGTVEKRPVVIDDAIAIRTMAYLTLGYDHRLVDGAVGDQFMADVKNQIENFDAAQV